MEDAELDEVVAGLAPSVDVDDTRRVVRYLEELGADCDEIADALTTGAVGALALEVAMRGSAPTVPFGEAAEQAGLSFEDAARHWRALGFPEPTHDAPRLPPQGVEALSLVVTAGRALLGDDAAISLARVMGGATARVAQAVVDAFRVQFETRQLAAGAPYSEVVQQYVSVAQEALPGFVDALGDVFLRHLLAVAAGAWSPDAEGSTARRDTVVGFVDIVGYTVLSQTIRPADLARLIDAFEGLVAEKVVGAGGQVVKLIGDAALFVVDDAADACRVALDIVAAAERAGLPRLRAGLAAGDVITLHGDVFGEVVNLAARLVAVAPENLVVADGEVRTRSEGAVAFTPLPPQDLKGFGTPATAYLVG
ncbi:MAG: adenylate/guanylate cyclase domain-containing protein [Actinobacteria bacterium]|nr:adenylate/guanylate cyclase domain-containing protein [Actinomycetota bacterium]